MSGGWDFWNEIFGFYGVGRKKGVQLVACGCMNAAKSLCLLLGLTAAQNRGRKIQNFIPLNAMPIGRNVIESRVCNGDVPMTMLATRLENPLDILTLLDSDTQVVGIDEAHFFDKRLIYVCDTLVERGIVVLVSGLDQDFRGEPFPGSPIPDLMVKAYYVEKLQGICEICGKPSTRSQRYKENGEVAPWTDETVKEEKCGYKGLCNDCWVEPPGKPKHAAQLVNFNST